jgi:hypothetical protein
MVYLLNQRVDADSAITIIKLFLFRTCAAVLLPVVVLLPAVSTVLLVYFLQKENQMYDCSRHRSFEAAISTSFTF